MRYVSVHTIIGLLMSYAFVGIVFFLCKLVPEAYKPGQDEPILPSVLSCLWKGAAWPYIFF